MKSTGEVLGIGKTTSEALFKGLTAAGFKVPSAHSDVQPGVLISVDSSDEHEIVSVAKRFSACGLRIYATEDTARAIASLGIPVTSVPCPNDSPRITELMEDGSLNYIIYTGALRDGTLGDFATLHRRAMQLRIPCLTSPDTAGALAEIIESRYTEENTELVDINRMRTWRSRIQFSKMHSCGNDYIFIENFDGRVTCPESLCVALCTPHYGIGGDGIVLIEHSRVADAKMRSFNRDGSEGRMAGNNIRCVAKLLYDKGYIRSEYMTIESGSGVHRLRLYLRNGKVSSVSVDMGRADLSVAAIPASYPSDRMVNAPITVGGTEYRATCVSVGNPHCVVFTDAIDSLQLSHIGPLFEHAAYFPERVNTEFVFPVDRTTLSVRVWERGNGETLACGTGAAAAVVAATELGMCDRGTDIKVKLAGGELTVNYTDERIILTGSAVMVYDGEFEY